MPPLDWAVISGSSRIQTKICKVSKHLLTTEHRYTTTRNSNRYHTSLGIEIQFEQTNTRIGITRLENRDSGCLGNKRIYLTMISRRRHKDVQSEMALTAGVPSS